MLSNLTKLIGGAAHIGKGHKEETKLNQTTFELKGPHGSGADLMWAWQPAAGGGALLATGGADMRCCLHAKDGHDRETLKLKGKCQGLEWSKEGEALGVINAVTSHLAIYDASKGKKREVAAPFQDPLTCLAWSKTSLLLACGSKAGNVLMYNHANGKSGAMQGKHKAPICGCAWSLDGQLAICAEDNTLSLSHENGQTFAELKVRAKPSSVSYGRADNNKDSLLALMLGSEAVFVLNVDRKDGPVELTFSERYGRILQYKWHQDGLLMIGFTKGYFNIVSTNPSNMGTELFQVRDYHTTDLAGIAVCSALGLCATISNNSIRTHHIEDPKDTVGSLEVRGEHSLRKIDWSDDGNVLTVSSDQGNVYSFPGSIKRQAAPAVAKADAAAKKATKKKGDDGSDSHVTAARLYTLHNPHGPGGIFFAWQRRHGTYMATTGYNQMVNIYDRMGTMVDQIALPGNCTGFGWDMNGDILAVINEKNSAIILWDANYSSKTRVRQLDSGLRDPLSSLIWSRTSAYLAVGTAKGNLMIYNHQTSRRIPIMGKHTRRITCGAWNKQNLLALGGEDKTLSISNEFGDTMRLATLRAEPSQIQFSEMKMDGTSDGENTVSFIGDRKVLLLYHYLVEPAKDPIELTFKPAYGKLVAHECLVLVKKNLFLYSLTDPDNPVELAFQSRYGNISRYEWFGDGYILLGFSSGYFVAISSHMKEIGTELFQVKNHKSQLTDIAVNLALSKAASCGDNMVKIHELQEMKEIWSVLSLDDEKSVDQVEWSDDGQLLAVGCGSGNLHVYLSSLPILGGAAGTRIAVLTSLLEVTIMDYLRKEEAIPFTVDVEPSFLGIGPFHLIVGMNNRAWIYVIGDGGSPELVRDREYLGTVESVRLNADYASVLCDGVIQLHVLESETGESEEREGRLFPDPEHRDMKITCHYLTADFLIYGTDTGQMVFFYLEDWAVVNEYRHTMGVRQVFPEVNGTRVVFVDDRSEGHIFNPVNDLLERIVKFPPQALGVLWENYPLDRNVFIAWDRTTISTFVYTRENIDGAVVDLVDSTPLPAGQSPLLLYNGEVTLQTCSGRVTQMVLASHEMEANVNQYEEKELSTALKKNVALRRYKDAWTVAQALDKPEQWRQLGEACMKDLQIDMAMRVYKQMGDVGMLWSLETIRDIEDIKLLAGYVAMFLGDFDQAQTFFLSSGTPVAALEMRRDLLQWEMALQLANKLAPEQIPDISREYAHQLEFTGDYQQALQHYERGQSLAAEDATEEHKSQCLAGIARCSIRCGDIRKGVQLAGGSPSKLLKKECAEILEGMKQYNEAAVLFEKAGLYDRAAQMYIKLKNWNKVAELLPQVQSLKIHSQYAKAREAEGKYKEALAAYETAREYDSMVRILLDHLNNPQQAVAIVQESKSVEGARLVAKFFMKMGDFASAIQFLVMSKCIEEAFTLAQKHGQMDTFAEIIGNDGRPEDYKSMALHYENSMNYFLAGKFHHLAGDSTKGLKLLLKAATGAQEADAIMLAIDVVGEANSEGLAKQLIDFLLGEQDGVPKDPKYLFRLYMARKMYRESAKTAVIIAKEEQKVGSYRNAHDMLLGMYQELRKHKIRVPNELASNMMLLHSYILARILVKRNEHLLAARLLIRVSNNISKFPAHTVPILTSTVIECQRSGLKKSSFQFAAMLMKPEYRDQVDAKYRKKIEAVVRKPAKTEEEEFPAPCPFCDNMIAETELNCDKCKHKLPYCIASGRHVVKDDLTECPFCNFPAIRTEMAKFVESDDPCPMCNKGPIGAGELRIFPDASVFLPLMGEE